MGAVRKGLCLVTAGVVAPNSKKQRVAAQTLEAVVGQPADRVRRAGTRRAFLAPRKPLTPLEIQLREGAARAAASRRVAARSG